MPTPKKPDDQPRPPPSFIRFQKTMRSILKVSKAELDQRIASEREKKRQSSRSDDESNAN